ncbi:MAG: hypothetical protein WBG90_15580 [Saonia sp.]
MECSVEVIQKEGRPFARSIFKKPKKLWMILLGNVKIDGAEHMSRIK